MSGKIIVICAPSGTGKSTLINRLKDDHPRLEWSVSCTTRPIRPNEIDGKDYPIMFISKSFTSVQLRWSVPEKEGYAIVYAFIKMEHLLRDRHFDLNTDHENQTKLYS